MPEYKGLIMGWIVGMLGISAALWNYIVNSIINPENIVPTGPINDKVFPDEIAEKIPDLIRTLFCIHGVIALIVVIFVFKKPVPAPDSKTLIKEAPKDSKISQFLKSKDFLIVAFNTILTLGPGMFLCGI